MKKIFAAALAATMTFGVFGLTASKDGLLDSCISASADREYTNGDYRYTVNEDGTINISEYIGEGGVVTIPSEIINRKVTSIESWAFEECTNLISVKIPNSVTSIGLGAFRYCTSLKSVTLPNSVTNIECSTFYGCTSLTSITIPESVKNIDWNAFEHCEGLTSIVIPNSVTYIGNSAFAWCKSLTSITIPNSVKSVEKDTFYGCTNLKSVIMLNSVTHIGYTAFGDCTKLVSVVIPNSVTNIDDYAFANCKSLMKVTIPKSVTSIGENAFGYHQNKHTMKNEQLTGFIIDCYAGSAGEKYAKEQGFKYNLLHTHKIKVIPGKAATCTKAGYTSIKVCVDCGKILQAKKTIKATGKHVYKAVKVVKPTYTAKGYTLRKCSCGKTIKTNIIKKKVLGKTKAKTKFSATTNAVRVNWNKTPGATGYKIYRLNGKKWVEAGTVRNGKTTSFKVKGLKSGKTYKFKVKPFVKSGKKVAWGKASGVVTTSTVPKKAYIGHAAKSEKAIRFFWRKINAMGYQIQRYDYTAKKWKLIKTVRNNKINNYRFIVPRKNTIYKFRIRAYTKVGKKTIFGKWSNSKIVMAK